MAESKKDNVGATGDGLGDGVSTEAAGERQGVGGSEAESNGSAGDASTADSKGSIATGAGEGELTQASGGSVD